MTNQIKNLSEGAQELYNNLVRFSDGDDGEGNAPVYLDNISIEGMTGNEKAGYFSALESAGLYQPDTKYFGYVKV